MRNLVFISLLVSAFFVGLAERAVGAVATIQGNGAKNANQQSTSSRQRVDVANRVEGVDFFENFDSYTPDVQLVVQNSTDWETWSNMPGSGEDPFVSDDFAYSGLNTVVIAQNNDLVKQFGILTSGVWKLTWKMYIPTGKAGYFNTLALFAGTGSNWGMQVFFNSGGDGTIDAGVQSAASFTYAHDAWVTCDVIVDLDSDLGTFLLDGDEVYSWQWTLGALGQGSPLQLDANDFFGFTVNDAMYVDDYHVAPLADPDNFLDDFEAYTAAQQLVVQNNTDWDTWSSLPGSGEDPFVSNGHAYGGANSVVIAQNNDLVRLHNQRTTGSWGISFQVYIPTGKAGYFNTLSGFRPNPNYWAMETYFDAGGAGRLLTGDPQVDFTWTPDTWQQVEVIVDLDQDLAQFVFNGSVLHQWQWTSGTSGGTGPLELDANDFFGATANDEMYVDDYHFVADSLRPLTDPDNFLDDFEAYTAAQQLVVQNNTDWDTWSSLPGSGEDPFVSNGHAYGGANSVVIAQNNDLVRLHGQRTTGSWGISFQVYIPTGKAGYFNTLSGFRPNPNYWAMETYFDAGGAGRLLTGDPQVDFTWTPDTWQQVEVIVDLDQDLAQFVFNGSVLHQWQWTSGTSGGTGPLELDANDFFGATANDEMYVDDYHFVADSLRSTLGVNPGDQVPVAFALEQNYPNPFNPTTTIEYALKERSRVLLKVYDIVGKEVRTLINEEQTAGVRRAIWDGRNNSGSQVSSGIYFYRIQAGSFVKSMKMILMK